MGSLETMRSPGSRRSRRRAVLGLAALFSVFVASIYAIGESRWSRPVLPESPPSAGTFRARFGELPADRSSFAPQQLPPATWLGWYRSGANRLCIAENGTFQWAEYSASEDIWCANCALRSQADGRWRHEEGRIVLESEGGLSSTFQTGHTSSGLALRGLTDLWQKID